MKILAAIDNSPAARPVLAVACSLGRVLDVDVEAVHVRENGEHTARAAAASAGVLLHSIEKPVIPALIEAGRSPDVSCMALGARGVVAGPRPAGHVALELVRSLHKPLVVVPPDAAAGTLRRILVPINGRRTTAVALAETLMLACRQELEVIVLHVHEQDSIPMFTDQPHYELESWAQEFLRRHAGCPYPERVRLEVRIGLPGENVLQVAEETDADLIALGWSQDLRPGHAAVVRAALERSAVPVLLTPAEGPVDLGDASLHAGIRGSTDDGGRVAAPGWSAGSSR